MENHLDDLEIARKHVIGTPLKLVYLLGHLTIVPEKNEHKATHLYAGIQTSGLLDVVNRTNI